LWPECRNAREHVGGEAQVKAAAPPRLCDLPDLPGLDDVIEQSGPRRQAMDPALFDPIKQSYIYFSSPQRMFTSILRGLSLTLQNCNLTKL
jgi:hypothetical protein